MPDEAVDGARQFLDSFANIEAVRSYTENAPRFVPGFDALHRMTGILLAEKVPPAARILVLGAGGGLELTALAAAYPGWTFTGIDPAQPMLDLAAQVMGAEAQRAELICGYIDDAPDGPFDGAVCLLTLHFLDRDERRRTVAEIHRRLKPGAPFVAAHSSFPQGPGDKELWLSRYAAFAVASGSPPEQAEQARAAVAAAANMLEPQEDEAILRQGGFADAALFYAAFTWRGWIGHA